MRSTRRSLFVLAIALWIAASISSSATAQDLADRRLEVAMRRSYLWEYWAARQQEQIDYAHYRSHATYGQLGAYYATQAPAGYRVYGPRQFYGPALITSGSAVAAAASQSCIGPLGIECSPLDCDCDHYDCGY
jgi:hypothetical protein